jgi:5-methylthioribose kinase
MEAAAADHRVWKADLLAGTADETIAEKAGELLAAIHRETADQPELKQRFGDRTVFDELRVDPFYRYVLPKHPPIAPALARVIEEVLTLTVCVVHADFSPKNLLLADGKLTLVDFETGHFGDPAFDLGFFLSHLFLKTIKHTDKRALFLALAQRFCDSYWKHLGGKIPGLEDLQRRTLGNLAGCLLARIDGKSPIDYFDQPWQSETARALAFTYLMRPVTRIAQAFEEIEKILANRSE